VVPAVAVVPVVPVVPVVAAAPGAGVAAALAGASFKHPVTVIRRSALAALLCGAAGVCAVIAAAVVKPAMPVNTPVQIVFFIVPPWSFLSATVGPQNAPGRRHSMRMLVFDAVSHAVRWRHCCCDQSQAHRNHHSAGVVA
jgi:hypothetical protein